MNKICTSLEQSQKLIELGIDVSTADTYWSRCTITDFGDGVLKVSYAVEPCNISQFRYTKEDVPAWSLSALLDILESELDGENGTTYQLHLYKAGTWWDISYDEVYDEACPIEVAAGEELVDVCVEMIEKLHKLKML